MKNEMVLGNYGLSCLSIEEQLNTDGGKKDIPGETLLGWGVELAMAVVTYFDKHTGPGGGSSGYHCIMSSSNYGGIR